MPGTKDKNSTPINVLIDELKSDDVRKRINSVKNLDQIALTLGPDRTRNELLPFLNELQDDEDTLLLQLCKSLENFHSYIGGVQYIQVLLQVLEWLCKSDESIVREKAAQNIKSYIQMIDVKKNEDMVVSMLKRLFESSYSYAKGPVVMIIPFVIKNVSSSNQQLLLSYFQKSAKDQFSAIRKQASQNFKDYVLLYPLLKEDFIHSIFNDFIKDEQDLVRLYLVDALVAYAQTDLINKNKSQFTTYLNKLSEDQSWRIKYYFCEKLNELLKYTPKDYFKSNILPVYQKYLSDNEPELRSISASRLDCTSQQLDADEVIKTIIPKIKSLASDQQAYVRQSMAGSFLAVSSVIGKRKTSEHILPIFLQLLKDQESDVRISLFKSLSEITKVLGVETLSQSILPALTELASDKNWRIRHSSIDIIGFFAKEIGADFLNDKIIQILMEWIKDSVFAVREQAIMAVKNLLLYLGSPWLEKNVMPKILHQQNVPNYLHRITILLLISQIGENLNQDYLSKTIYPVLTQLAKDPVPNVRMNVAKTFKSSAKYFKDRDAIKRLLQNLCDDSDFDVRYNAKVALDHI